MATLTGVERNGQYAEDPLPLRLWRAGMTRIVSRMEREIPSLVDAIFVENAWTYDHVREKTDEDTVHFAPPGIDTEMYHPADSAEEMSDYVLSAGRLGDSRKNVCLLIEAYHRLRQRIEDVPRLVLAGLSGPTERDWAWAEALGIRNHVEMHEDVPEAELAALYRNAGLFVLSSDEDGLGLVLAEAMASGRPVVSTACGGPSTTVVDGETGLLKPVGDPEALADAMATVLRHPNRADAMGAAGRERVVDEFSQAATGQRFLDVYQQLLTASE